MGRPPDIDFRQLCEGLGFTLVAVDRDLRVCFWNDQAAKQFGRSSDEMIGQACLDVFPITQRPSVQALLETTLEKQTPGEIEVKFHKDGGERKTFVLIVSPIFDSSGNCIGASAAMRDISKRKRLSQELARSRRMASLGNMAGGVAHHFNNILGGMLTSIDYVLPSDSPRELRRTLRLLAQAIGRATRITSQLAAFAESENETTEMVELNRLLDMFLDRIRPRAEKVGVKLVVDIEPVQPPTVFEAQRLMPVLESIGHNACDSMAAGGTMTVRMHQDRGSAVVSIEDTGCGIPEDLLDRVFEPFFTTKGELGGGTSDNIGLGLAAVHGLVSEMDGTIDVASKVGEGTRVTLRLPLSRRRRANGSRRAATGEVPAR